jgi:hypothetical protein
MNKKIWVLWIIAAFAVVSFGGATQASCLGTGSSCAENVTVEVEILPGDICIGTTGSFDFGQYTVSSSSQTQTGLFTDNFWVEDLKGADTGYYTTLQLSGDMEGPGSATIPAANVSVRVDDTTVVLIAWSVNTGVTIPAWLTTFTPLNGAVTFIEREDGPNDGLIGMYWKIPEMQVVIPAYQSVGTYTATLVYTLYEGNTP